MHHQVLQHLQQIQGQMPVTLPSHVSLVQLRQIAPYVERLHSSFARLLQTLSLQARGIKAVLLYNMVIDLKACKEF
jgi:hypothetical protein